MLREINTEWKYVKTYATEAALRKRIEQDKDVFDSHVDFDQITERVAGTTTRMP